MKFKKITAVFMAAIMAVMLLTVNVSAVQRKSLRFKNSSITMYVGDKVNIYPIITGYNSNDYVLSWNASPKNYVYISKDMTVTAIEAGTVTVYVEMLDTDYHDVCSITILPNIQSYTTNLAPQVTTSTSQETYAIADGKETVRTTVKTTVDTSIIYKRNNNVTKEITRAVTTTETTVLTTTETSKIIRKHTITTTKRSTKTNTKTHTIAYNNKKDEYFYFDDDDVDTVYGDDDYDVWFEYNDR